MTDDTILFDCLLNRLVRETEDRISHQNEAKEARLALAQSRSLAEGYSRQVNQERAELIRERNDLISKNLDLDRQYHEMAKKAEEFAAEEAKSEPKMKALFEAAQALENAVMKHPRPRDLSTLCLKLHNALSDAEQYCDQIPF